MPNPFAGALLHVDPHSQATHFCEAHPSDPRTSLIREIAGQPQAFWLTDNDAAQHATSILRAAGEALVVFVVYGVPQRDAGGHSRGGQADLQAYKGWIDAIASACGSAYPVFILEPDGLVQADSLMPNALRERYACLTYAVDRLAPAGAIYVDMSHPGWRSPDDMVWRYNQLGTRANTGFSINVSNYYDDTSCLRYAERLRELGGKPSVIDTSRNGQGSNGDWCNPPGRGLGHPPLRVAPSLALDANLWIKRPGESDGECNHGVRAGYFLPDAAAELVRLRIDNDPAHRGKPRGLLGWILRR